MMGDTFPDTPAPTHRLCACGHARWSHYDLTRSCMKCLCKGYEAAT